MLNDPLLPVTADDVAPVPLCFAVTSAPGMTPPEASATVPDSEVSADPAWAYAAVLAAHASATRKSIRTMRSLP